MPPQANQISQYVVPRDGSVAQLFRRKIQQ
jgi:hypothetical protein